jgi:hypothetical protein
MQFRLRTLLIMVAVGPVVLALALPAIKPIADDYWVLKYGPEEEVIERYIVFHSGPAEPPPPRGFHPIAEFLAKVLP